MLATGIPHKGRVLNQISLVLVRFPGRHRSESPDHRRRRTLSASGRASMPTNFADARCWCGARKCFLSNALCADTFPAQRGRNTRRPERLRHSAAGGLEGIRRIPGADFHSVDQSYDRTRRKHFVRSDVRDDRRGERQPSARSDAARLQEGCGAMPANAASSSPTRSSSLAAPRMASRWRMKSSLRILPASGPPTNMLRDGAGFVRQAVCSRLSRTNSLEQAAARTGSAAGRGAPDQRKVSRGVFPAHRTQAGCVTRYVA